MLRYFIFIEYGLLPDLRVGVLISASHTQIQKLLSKEFPERKETESTPLRD